MSYIVVDVDGQMHVRDTQPTLDAIRREVGEPGFDQIRLRVPGRGFVNDVGHVQGLPRNVVGSVLLLVCGAAELPYAGPVVVTGWDRHAWESEVLPLRPDVLDALRDLHTDIRHALDGDQAAGTECRWCTPEWQAEVRRAAIWMTAAPTPTLAGWPL